MRRVRPRLTYANVMSTIAVFGVLGGGVAYAANTVFSSDIVNGEVKSPDIGNNQVFSADVRDDSLANGGLGSADIANRQLNDEDLGLTVVNFLGSIGTVPANDCVDREVSGIAAGGDHLVLTPARSDSWAKLIYTAEYYDPAEQSALIVVCNPTGSAVDDGTTHFNLLVIDAQ